MKKITLDLIYDQIITDPMNKKYIKKGWIPIYSVSENSKILIIGQAPGIKAQEEETTWLDKSGDQLRNWLNVDKDQFYNKDIFGLLPMDFFFPGKAKTGDLPPRKEFYEKYHHLILNNLNNVELIILIGNYSQKFYLKDSYNKNLTNTVKTFQKYLPRFFPLPHPSPLNFRWFNNNPWFFEQVLTELKTIVHKIIKGAVKY